MKNDLGPEPHILALNLSPLRKWEEGTNLLYTFHSTLTPFVLNFQWINTDVHELPGGILINADFNKK